MTRGHDHDIHHCTRLQKFDNTLMYTYDGLSEHPAHPFVSIIVARQAAVTLIKPKVLEPSSVYRSNRHFFRRLINFARNSFLSGSLLSAKYASACAMLFVNSLTISTRSSSANSVSSCKFVIACVRLCASERPATRISSDMGEPLEGVANIGDGCKIGGGGACPVTVIWASGALLGEPCSMGSRSDVDEADTVNSGLCG